MRSKHKIAKATDLKLEVMFENEKPVLDRIINKEIDVLKSSSKVKCLWKKIKMK